MFAGTLAKFFLMGEGNNTSGSVQQCETLVGDLLKKISKTEKPVL